MDMISLHDIQKSYGSHQVLKNVDLTIRQCRGLLRTRDLYQGQHE